MTRIAMIGAGGVAQRHVGVLSTLADVQVVTVTDPAPGAAEALAATCDATPFTDIERGLEAQVVDAAYVCVPPFAHGDAERAVLARGLPMFVEKPVSVDLALAEEIDRLVTETGVVTATGYHWRCLEQVATAQQMLEAAPALLASGSWLDKRPPVSWWGHTRLSGGQVIEQLTHVLDLARLLLGEPVEVYAAGARRAGSETSTGSDGEGDPAEAGDVDDATAATVRFASGAVATLAATSLLPAKQRASLHTVSAGFSLELSEAGLVVDDGSSREVHRPSADPRTTVDQEFVDAVRGRRASTRAPYAEAVRTHRFGCAVAESARTGRPVRLGGEQS